MSTVVTNDRREQDAMSSFGNRSPELVVNEAPELLIKRLQHKAVKARTPMLGHHHGTTNTTRTLTALN